MTVTINGTTGITNDGGYTGDGVVFADTTPANTLVTTTGGNVGVGTTSPGYRLDVAAGDTTAGFGYAARLRSNATAAAATLQFTNSTVSAENAYIRVTDAGLMSFSNKAYIDSSGNLLVGTTSSSSNSGPSIVQSVQSGNETYIRVNHNSAASSGGWFMGFSYNGTAIGSITQNGTTAVAYNTTSDYRLKENIQPMIGALARVAALNPCTYTWKSAPDEIGEGFIAHELQEVCPQAVTGEKDAVDEDGNAKYQSIDTSFLVATLTAAIQEQQAIITALTARVEALEGAQA
jgi:hypothetical protein